MLKAKFASQRQNGRTIPKKQNTRIVKNLIMKVNQKYFTITMRIKLIPEQPGLCTEMQPKKSEICQQKESSNIHQPVVVMKPHLRKVE
jgi:hypothetical protein